MKNLSFTNKYLGILIASLLIHQSLQAQVFSPLYPKVFVNNTELKNPWGGGFNNPQFSQLKVDEDSIPDLVVFDKSASVTLFFRKDRKQDTIWAPFSPKIELPILMDWAIFKDFNKDGVMDIIASSFYRGVSGVDVYQGYKSIDSIKFNKIKFSQTTWDVIPIPSGGSSGFTQLYITNFDIPAVDDVDRDGDLDILTFNPSGGQMEWYSNQSLEMGYGLDSLIFRLKDPCWGKFYETGVHRALKLSSSPTICASPLQSTPIELRHIGSTTMAFDPDKDNDTDVLLGDISFNTMVHLTNTGTKTAAFCTSQDTIFPYYDHPIDLIEYPAAFAVDENLDGSLDVVASPNEVYFILDYEAKAPLYLFDTISHAFKRKTDNFLGSEMLDFGTNSAPCFLDVNGDNLKDLIVANNYQISKNDIRSTQLYLFLNIGTEQIPVFNLVDSNYLNLKTTTKQYFELVPFAGDINADGDNDLMIGTSEGYLIFIENLSDNPKIFTPATAQLKYQQIYAGRSSAPCMFDYNKDGKMDLIVGEKNGNVNYFENIGGRDNPQYNPNPASDPNTELWANINTRNPLYGSGFGQVNIFNYNNEPIIITTNEAGKIQGYTLKDNTHTPINLDHLGLPFVGEKLRLSAADINGDGILELALGNNRGGVSLFTSPFKFENPLSSKQLSAPLFSIKLFPNPVKDILYIRATMDLMDARYSIFDINGKILAKGTIPDQNSSINLNPDWNQGIYFITFTTQKGTFSTKFVK